MTRSRRRANGEGAIYKTADGRWRAAVDLGWEDRKRVRRYVSGRSKEDVAAKLRAMHRSIDTGLPIADGRPPKVREWLAVYLDDIAAPKLRPRTLVTYRGYVDHHVLPAIGDVRLNALRPEHLERMYRGMSAKGLAPASILQTHRILSRALKVAHQRNLVGRNVAQLIDAPSVQRTEINPLTTDEAKAVLDAAKGSRNAARWSVALALGLRQGEALGLSWDDIDLSKGVLTVKSALQRRPWAHGCADPTQCGLEHKKAARPRMCPQRTGGGLHLVQPKSEAGRRSVALPQPLADALRLHRVAQAQERLQAGSGWQDTGLVFTTELGAPIDAGADYRAWKALLERAEVRHARLHDARHTAATVMLTLGVPARVAMQILGHSQIGLTLGTYSHVVPELATDAADRMGDALWGT